MTKNKYSAGIITIGGRINDQLVIKLSEMDN